MTICLDGSRIDFGGAAGASMGSGSPGSIHSMVAAMNRAGTGGGRVDQMRDSRDGVISPDEVAAVEIYPLSGSVPDPYQHLNGTCGVIAIWTK